MKRQTIWNRQYTMAFLANFMLCFSQQSVNTLVSSYAAFLGAGAVLIGAISGLYFGVAVAARPFSGPIINNCDKRKIMIYTYALGVITGVLYALSRSIAMFVIARILHGIEFAFVGSLNLTVASNSLPKDKLGTGIGVFGVSGAIATAIGPGMGIALYEWATKNWNETVGYMLVFFLSAGFMLLGLIPALLLDPCKPTKEERAALGAWYKSIAAKEAVIPAVLMCLLSMANILYTVYMVPYAASKSIERVSLFFTVYAIFLLVTRPLCGKLVDRFGINKAIYPSVFVYALSFVMVATAKSTAPLVLAAIPAALGYGTLNPAVLTLCMRCVPYERRGVASNTEYFGMDIGYFVGPFIGGATYNAFGYSNMYLLGMVPIFVLGVIFFFGWRVMKNRLY